MKYFAKLDKSSLFQMRGYYSKLKPHTYLISSNLSYLVISNQALQFSFSSLFSRIISFSLTTYLYTLWPKFSDNGQHTSQTYCILSRNISFTHIHIFCSLLQLSKLLFILLSQIQIWYLLSNPPPYHIENYFPSSMFPLSSIYRFVITYHTEIVWT